MNPGRLRMIILGSAFVVLFSYVFWQADAPKDRCLKQGGVWQDRQCHVKRRSLP